MDRIGFKQQAKLHNNKSRRRLSIHRKLYWAWPFKSHDNKSGNHHKQRNKHNKRVQQLIALCLVGTATPTFASDIGGVSATANPVANSSGSVTNQAIQVLQGPYITNTYGGGIQCQGPTMNVTPFVTGNIAIKRPYEEYWMDPVYNNVDANDDDVPDNPGEILYYKPVKTNQKDSSTLSEIALIFVSRGRERFILGPRLLLMAASASAASDPSLKDMREYSLGHTAQRRALYFTHRQISFPS